MKGKRHRTEDKIRILREAGGGKRVTSTRAKDQHSIWPSFRDPLSSPASLRRHSFYNNR